MLLIFVVFFVNIVVWYFYLGIVFIYLFLEMGKFGKLQKSRKNKKFKNVDVEYFNEFRGFKK